MDRTITASDANQRFSELLRNVQSGDSFTVLSRGRAVARVVPVEDSVRQRERVADMLTALAGRPRLHAPGWRRQDLYE
jgi:prevent-host-death family protein